MGRVVTNMKGRAVPVGDWLSKAVEVGVRNLAGPGNSERKGGRVGKEDIQPGSPVIYPYLEPSHSSLYKGREERSERRKEGDMLGAVWRGVVCKGILPLLDTSW